MFLTTGGRPGRRPLLPRRNLSDLTNALFARSARGIGDETGTGHGDSSYTILATDRYVYTNANFTASRTWTLPAANSVNAGGRLLIADLQGTITATNTLVISRAGSDTIDGGTSATMDVAFQSAILISDGVSKWKYTALRPYGTSAGQAIRLDSSAKLPAVDGSALTGVKTNATVDIIASASFPAAATLSITSIPATYRYIVLQCAGVSCDTTTRIPFVRVSTNNGSSYDATANNYLGFNWLSGTGGVNSANASLLANIGSQANTATIDFNIAIFGYQGNQWPTAMGGAVQSTPARNTIHSIYVGSTSAINALQVLWNGSGNFDAGTYALYGIS